MKYKQILLLLIFISSQLFAAGTVKSENLKGVKKQDQTLNKAKTVKKVEKQIDYSKLKGISSGPVISRTKKSSKNETKDFYKKLGTISIRASEDYVYIRAGKSSIIMDKTGKIVIDSSRDLILSSHKDLIFKAKGDIMFRPGNKLLLPNSDSGEKEPAEKTKKSK